MSDKTSTEVRAGKEEGLQLMNDHRDVAGNAINVGDFIVYATTHSRSAALHYGRVVSLKVRKHRFNDEPDIPTIGIMGVGSSYFNDEWSLLKDSKEVTIGELNRVLVVPATQVHPDALKLLNQGG